MKNQRIVFWLVLMGFWYSFDAVASQSNDRNGWGNTALQDVFPPCAHDSAQKVSCKVKKEQVPIVERGLLVNPCFGKIRPEREEVRLGHEKNITTATTPKHLGSDS